ncbi:MAG: trigger factor [Defluviitaleaceae bacterium]|nr:trigger factor [Defluviitaleaceae bacterium]
MSSTYEVLEDNLVKLTLNIDSEEFDKAINVVYNKEKKDIRVQGFRKGKAPRKIIELHYGKGVFYVDAINHLLPDLYEDAIKEHELEIVSEPDFSIEDMSIETGAVVVAAAYQKPTVIVAKEDYIGVTFTALPPVELDPEEVEREIAREQDLNTRLVPVERSVQDKDVVVIDFEGFLGDKPFSGGAGEDYRLTIGSNTFVPGFESQLIGKNRGDEVVVDITFPEDYRIPDLKGQDAWFEVFLKDVFEKEVPELDDEFAQDVSEFDTFEEYKQDVKERLQQVLNEKYEITKNNVILFELAKKIEINVPVSMVETEVDTVMQNMKNRLQMQGNSFESYLEVTGQTHDELYNNAFPMAEQNIKIGLILDRVADLEGFEATEEEIKEEVTKMAKSYYLDPEKYYETLPDNIRKDVKGDVKRQKANKMIVENAIEIAE